MQLEERLDLIDSLPSLPSWRIQAFSGSLYTEAVDPNKSSGTVGPDMLNIYLPGVSQQNRTDVDYCKLLVQNAANAKFHPTQQLYEWYKYYTDTLATLGWITQVSQTKNVTIKKTALTMDAVAFEILQGLLGPNVQKFPMLANKLVNGVKNNQGLVTIFERNKTLGYEAKFEISPVWQTAEGGPAMVMCCNSIDVRESKGGILWWRSTSQSTAVKSGAHAAYLNMNIYDKMRGLVEEKVLGKAKTLLGTLPDL